MAPHNFLQHVSINSVSPLVKTPAPVPSSIHTSSSGGRLVARPSLSRPQYALWELSFFKLYFLIILSRNSRCLFLVLCTIYLKLSRCLLATSTELYPSVEPYFCFIQFSFHLCGDCTHSLLYKRIDITWHLNTRSLFPINILCFILLRLPFGMHLSLIRYEFRFRCCIFHSLL